MIDAFSYDFMQRALLAAVLIGLVAPTVGAHLLQRRLALIGDGLGHVALAGVALGVLTGTAPVGAALVVAVVGAVAIELIRSQGRAGGDVALAVLFYGGIAGGVVLLSLAPEGRAVNLDAYLFGAITTTTSGDLTVFAVLSVAVLAITVGLGRYLLAVGVDEGYARASGLPVAAANLALAVTTAVTVVVSMRVVGLLLISALMIVPVVTAQQLARGFWRTMATASVLGVAAGIGGVAASYELDTPSGGTIVLLSIAGFLVALAVRGVVGTVRRHRTPAQGASA